MVLLDFNHSLQAVYQQRRVNACIQKNNKSIKPRIYCVVLRAHVRRKCVQPSTPRVPLSRSAARVGGAVPRDSGDDLCLSAESPTDSECVEDMAATHTAASKR